MVGPYSQTPPNSSLFFGVLVVVLRRQRVSVGYAYFTMASQTPIDAGEWRGRTGLMLTIERLVVRLLDVIGVFINGQRNLQLQRIYSMQPMRFPASQKGMGLESPQARFRRKNNQRTK
jgi:hypothetical protein